MPPDLQRRFDAIEAQRDVLQRSALALRDFQPNWSLQPDVWSVRQIMEHLVLSDETLGRAHAAGTVGTEAPVFRVLPRALRRALVLRAFARDAVLPLPSPAVEPIGDVPLFELLPRWAASRTEMRRVLGPLAATQMLDLAYTHTAYHTRQIEALQRDAAYPRGEGT